MTVPFEPEERVPRLSHRLRAMATFAVALWIMLSLVWHLVDAVRVAAGPQPGEIRIRLGWPTMQVSHSSAASDSGAVAGGATPGVVAPGVVQPVAEATEDDHDDDPGLDVRCRWEDGKFVGCGLFLGPIAVADVPWWLACVVLSIVICAVIILILGAILDWVCNTEWIKDEGVRRRCKKKKCKKWCLCCNKWFCWLEVFVQWLARQVCKWKEIILTALFIICVVAFIVILCF